MQDVKTEGNGGPPAGAGVKRSKECDLVMKGGITSGIVYPPLVIKLHEAGYSFRNVGGTSAGAIAAAVTAAAECGKGARDEQGRGGFEKLDAVRRWLGTGSNLLNLFQPSEMTRPLFDTAMELMSRRKQEGARRRRAGKAEGRRLSFAEVFRFVAGVCRWLPKTAGRFYAEGSRQGLFVAAAAAFALALLAAAAFTLAGALFAGWRPALKAGAVGFALFFMPLAAALGFAGERAGGLVGVARGLYDILGRDLRRNFFGLCSGREGGGFEGPPLSDWLHETLNDLAGLPKKGRPLTFGDLWDAPAPSGGDKGIDLRMMTSNLSQNQPYLLPFEKSTFLFKPAELHQLFPPAVVEHMVAKARPCRGVVLPAGYLFLPEARELPVVFATRMSLSFPVLISMVPLHTISQKAFEGQVRCQVEEVDDPGRPGRKCEVVVFSRQDEEGGWQTCLGETQQRLTDEDTQANWFSDGGICSNFPIHFFDSWLPTRPTFGVNLTSQLAEGARGAAAVADKIKERSAVVAQLNDLNELPGAAPARCYADDVYLPRPDENVPPQWVPLEGLGQFLESIFRTAQNYRDNMQAMLPSYRERIVQIRLTDDEGGLNLNMDAETIDGVVEKGQTAGEKLVHDFRMDEHQWVRFRVLMKQMEASLGGMYKNLRDCEFYMNTLANPPLPENFPYPRSAEWCRDAKQQLDQMRQTVAALKPHRLFAEETYPLPEPVLRVMPEI